VTTRGIVWFRRDLRLTDNPAWTHASEEADVVTALFVLDPDLLGSAAPFRQAQLLSHLRALDDQLREHGGRLVVRHGRPEIVVPQMAHALRADVVHANADVTRYGRRRDARVAGALETRFTLWWGNYVHAPGSLVTAGGTTSRVFTPFAKKWFATPIVDWPEAKPVAIDGAPGDPLPAPAIAPFQAGGERAAHERLRAFTRRVDDYPLSRDTPGIAGTSELSADLRFGTISPRQILGSIGTWSEARRTYVRQLAWRDWFAHLLWEHPSLTDTALRPELRSVRWENDRADIEAWKSGRTGFPIVDAGMRQLSTTGWMHNRVRMITASFLVKDLLVDWRIGERWFRTLLVDGDVAQNAGNWQWVAGTGPDAAPYFRIFNPTLQARKFDPDGRYVRRFVPELASLPDRWIHDPSAAPPAVLADAGITLGSTYPRPIIDHSFARSRVLGAYGAARSNGRGGTLVRTRQ
jgi:deoxyribodipyrimidine photo-lyase